MTLQTEIRGYIRGIPAIPVDRQRELAAIAKCRHVYEWGEHGRKINVRDAWIKSLRPGDIAWLADIRCLTLPKPPRKSGPMRDLGAAIAAVLATGAIIHDDRTGISSRDRARWANHVSWALETARNAERNQKRAKKRGPHNPSPRALATKWLAASMAEQREAVARIWRDPKFKTAAEAQAAMPEALQRVSMRTLYTIFDVRRPDDPTAGGRGKKRKR